MTFPKVVMCGGARSPIGAIAGELSSLRAFPLLSQIAVAALHHSKCDPKQVEYHSDAIGAPTTTPGTTLHENCASGAAAIHDVARRITLGEITVGVPSGVECMPNVPRYLFNCRTKKELYGDLTLVDGLMAGLTDPNVSKKGELMGLLTERLVEKYGVLRELQDEIAFRSHVNAVASWEEGMYDYVTPVQVKTREGVQMVEKDAGDHKYMIWLSL
ncbi:Thiolase [Trypanosoma melophagium]|uniref:Thiolase n=1 Tax=Trypanosoma melophagium TaxID=715481 RepID=UPI00351A4615|nr:Thiolase [Trypanosoma melophagium]